MKLLHTIYDVQGRVLGHQLAAHPARAIQLWKDKHPDDEPFMARDCNFPPPKETPDAGA